MQFTIYCDLDGVLYDWEKYVLENYYPHLTLRELNKLPNREVELGKMYEKEPNLFANLPLTPLANKLIAVIDAYIKDSKLPISLCFLTAAGTSHHDTETVKADKINALLRDFGGRIAAKTDIIVVKDSADKLAFAKNGAFLIDDFDVTVEAWIEAGGHGYLWKPHNPQEVACMAESLEDVLHDWAILYKDYKSSPHC